MDNENNTVIMEKVAEDLIEVTLKGSYPTLEIIKVASGNIDVATKSGRGKIAHFLEPSGKPGFKDPVKLRIKVMN